MQAHPLRSTGDLVRSMQYPLLLMAGYATLIVALYRGTSGAWITLPWSLPAMLGLTLAITSGFKAMRGQEHAGEARGAWASIAAASRSWALLSQGVVQDRASARSLVQRHLAWLAALRVQARLGGMAQAGTPASLARERAAMLKRDLARHVGVRELGRVLAADNAASAVLGLQAESLGALLSADLLDPAPFLELHRLLHELQRLQGAAERLQDAPEAARSVLADRLLLAAFGLLLPFGLLDAMGPLVLFDDALVGALACAIVVPLSVGFIALYVALAGDVVRSRPVFDTDIADEAIGGDLRRLEQELRTTLAASAIVSLQAMPSVGSSA